MKIFFLPCSCLVITLAAALTACQAPSNSSKQGEGPLAKSMPLGSKVDRMTAFATAKVIAPGAPDFPPGPAISVYFGDSLIGCTVSRAEMDAFVGVKENTPVKISGIVAEHNFLGVWLKPGCSVTKS